MSNKALISLVIVLLIGILSIAIIRKNQPQEESVGSEISKSINEGAEEVADEIDDHTDDK